MWKGLDERNKTGCHEDDRSSERVVTTCFLTLPEISEEVRTEYVSDYEKEFMNLGMKLYEKGHIKDTGQSISEAMRDGVDNWMRSMIPEVDDIKEFGMGIVSNSEDELTLVMGNEIQDASIHNISGLLDIHKKNKRLAWILLRCLEYTRNIFPVLTPNEFFWLVSRIEWMGEYDEKYAIEEAIADGMGLDEIEIVRKKDVYKRFPRWSIEAGVADWDKLLSGIDEKSLSREEIEMLELAKKIKDDCFSSLKSEEENGIIDSRNELMSYYAMSLFSDLEDVRTLEYRIINNLHVTNMEGGGEECDIEFDFNAEKDIDGIEAILKMLNKTRKNVLSLLKMMEP